MKVRYVLTNRDPAHLAQFSEYDVLVDGEKIGSVSASASTHYSKHYGRRVVIERTWAWVNLDSSRGGTGLGTRTEATGALLRHLGLEAS